MTCKDCIHYCICKDTLADENWREDTPQEIKDMYSPKGCENFKNKEDFIEVVHARWYDGRCTNCCHEALDYLDDYEMKTYTTKYCPECGAIMIKEK